MKDQDITYSVSLALVSTNRPTLTCDRSLVNPQLLSKLHFSSRVLFGLEVFEESEIPADCSTYTTNNSVITPESDSPEVYVPAPAILRLHTERTLVDY
jgi:hypothetical protein